MTPLSAYTSILITGGTGSFGQRFIQRICKEFTHFERIIVFSRDEYKQYKMAQKYPKDLYPTLEFMLGDVRDLDRLREAFYEVDLVIHAAALKQVDTSERNSMEFIKTNVIGAANVIQAAQERKVKKIIALSSDKAINPSSLYGASKLCAEKLFLEAAQHRLSGDSVFAIVRYGNVLATRGSVIPRFIQEKTNKVLSITHPEMTRFSVPVGRESALVFFAIEHSQGGEIFIPKSPSYKIMDVAKAICPECEIKIVGIRPGEKLKEDLIDVVDADRTYDSGEYYIIFPPEKEPQANQTLRLSKVPEGFHYTSDTNKDWLNVMSIQEQLRNFMQESDIPEL